jgi:hypothetical protein
MGGNERLERPVRAGLTASEGRRFAVPVGLAFLALAGITWWRDHPTISMVFGSVSGALLLAGLLIPSKLGPVYRAWMGFALLISKVTTPIFLGIVYFLVFTPTGMVMRLLGRNPMRREAHNGTYWLRRDQAKPRSDMTRQF